MPFKQYSDEEFLKATGKKREPLKLISLNDYRSYSLGGFSSSMGDVVNNPDFAENSQYIERKPSLALDDYSLAVNKGLPTATLPKAFRGESLIQGIGMMTPEEKSIYNYYYNTQGNSKANEYLRGIEKSLIQRAAHDIQQEADTPIKKAVYSALGGLDSGMRGLRQIGNIVTGKEAEQPSALEQGVSLFRQDDQGIQKIANDLLYSAGNMVPSLLVGNLTGSVGGAITQGLSSGGNNYADAIENGKSVDDALLYGTLSGLSEGGLQYLLGGIENLGKGGLTKTLGKTGIGQSASAKLANVVTNPAAKKVLTIGKDVVSNVLDEATEEYIQAIIDPVLRNTVLGENNEINPLSEDTLYSALLGGITGGAFSLPSAVSSARVRNTQTENREVPAINREPDTSLVRSSSISPEPLYDTSVTQNTPDVNTSISENGGMDAGKQTDTVPDMSETAKAPSYAQAEELHRQAQAAQERLVGGLHEAVDTLGFSVEDGGAKSVRSILDKVARKQAAGDGGYDLYTMKDHARAAVLTDRLDELPAAVVALKKRFPAMTGEAFLEQPLNNTGYRGVHLTVPMGDGINAEIQIHTKETWRIKKLTDAIYDKWRNVEIENAAQESAMLADFKNSERLWDAYYSGITPEVIRMASDSVMGLASQKSAARPRNGTNEEFLNSIMYDSEAQNNRPSSDKEYFSIPSTPSSIDPLSSDPIIPQNAAEGNGKSNAGTQYDRYTQPKERWTADNVNEGSKVETTPSLQEIVNDIRRDFGIPISSGRVGAHNANGIYNSRSQVIRTQISNALPTIAHELGHHMDNLYGIYSLPEIDEAIYVMNQETPGFAASYTPQAIPKEAVAEFLRRYLTDRTAAQDMYPAFYDAFRNRVDKSDLAKLDAIGDKVNRYMSATRDERFSAGVVSRKKADRIAKAQQTVSDRFHDVAERAQAAFIDDMAAIKKVSERAYMNSMVAKTVSSRVESAIDYRVVDFDGNYVERMDAEGNPTGEYIPGFIPLVQQIAPEDMRSFSEYLVARRSLELVEQGKRVRADDTLDDPDYLRSKIADFEKANPDFQRVSDQLYDWQRSLMKTTLVDTGLISEEAFLKLNEKYKHYVPFYRNMQDGGKQNGVKRSVANQKAPIKRYKGSGRDILDPLESIILNVDRFYRAGERNAVMRIIAEDVETQEGFGFLMERVSPNKVPQSVSTESVSARIEKLLNNGELDQKTAQEIGESIDEILGDSLTKWTVNQYQGQDIVTVMNNGNPEYYQVHDKALLKALTAMDSKQNGVVNQCARTFTRMMKTLTTGANLGFSLGRNMWRDIATGFIQGSVNNPFKYTVDYFKALGGVFSKSEEYRRWKSSGGGYASPVSNPKTMNAFIGKLYKKHGNLMKRGFTKLVDSIEAIADAAESAPRMVEFNRVLKDTGDARLAAYEAAEVTTNFARSGTVSKELDAFIPYLNAAIQGTYNVASKAKSNPGRFAAKLITSQVLIALIEMAWNHVSGSDEDYQKTSSYLKNNYYLFSIGDGRFFRLPKAHLLSTPSSLVERTWEYLAGNDEAFYDFGNYLLSTFMPPTDIIGIGTALDLAKNETFTGAPIVPAAYQELEPEMQFDEQTTRLAKFIGSVFGISPMQVDYVISDNLGFIGDILESEAKGELGFPAWLNNTFIVDNAYSNDASNRFYDQYDKLKIQQNSYPDDVDALAEYERYDSARSILSALSKLAKEDESIERDIKALSRDYIEAFFSQEGTVDERILSLYSRTKEKSVFPGKTFDNTLKYEDENGQKQEVVLDAAEFLEYVEEYNEEIATLYDSILDSSLDDTEMVKALETAKRDLSDSLAQKYGGYESDSGVYAAEKLGVSPDLYFTIKYLGDTDESGTLSQDEARKALNLTSLSKEQKYELWWILGKSWTKNPYGPAKRKKKTTVSREEREAQKQNEDTLEEILKGALS